MIVSMGWPSCRLAVADDQLTLSATMGIMASMALMPVWQGLFNGLAEITPGALRSRGISYLSPVKRAFPIDRLAQCIYHAAEHAFTYFDRSDLAGTTHFRAFLESRSLPSIPRHIVSSRFSAIALTPFSNSPARRCSHR